MTLNPPSRPNVHILPLYQVPTKAGIQKKAAKKEAGIKEKGALESQTDSLKDKPDIGVNIRH
jgi:hypothetical protein